MTQITPVESARAVGLRYSDDKQAGIRRIKAGKGFRYTDERGRAVRDGTTLQRIRALAIPPAWTDVWISPHANAHLQATGRDAKGRKQHRYHALWREVRDATKYDRLIEFGEALPRIRQRVARDLAKPGLSREKVLATVIHLMDLTFIRVGNEEYARNNNSYGLTTLKDRHVRIRGPRVQFSFRGKSGQEHSIEVEDKRLAKIVQHCQDIPGQDLFQWMDDAGQRRDVTSGDVNDYLQKLSGGDFTAKDYRTWAGTVLIAQALKSLLKFHTQEQAKKNVTQAIKAVAAQLGNTPAVCRKCYVHPSLVEGYLKKKLPCSPNGSGRASKKAPGPGARPKGSLRADERDVLRYLRCCRREEEQRVRGMKAKLAAVPRAWHPRVIRGRRVGHR